jgi:hypothetical protein
MLQMVVQLLGLLHKAKKKPTTKGTTLINAEISSVQDISDHTTYKQRFSTELLASAQCMSRLSAEILEGYLHSPKYRGH